MNITHDMSNDLTEYDPESRQVDGPNPIENRISSSAARVPDIISCTSGITVQGRQLHSFAFTTDAAIIRNTVLKHWLDTLGLSATLELGGLRSTEYLRSMETIQPVDADAEDRVAG